jgi:hypothetical protein
VLARPRPGKENPVKDLDFMNHDSVTKDNCKQSMTLAVKSSRLVIQMTHPSTNILECFYVNKPVVALLSNDQPTEVVWPYYNFFSEAGVFHETMESLTEHINKIDLDKWWLELINTEEYKSFKNNFLHEV